MLNHLILYLRIALALNLFILKKFSRNNINSMNGMFFRCLSLKELNLNNFNTNNVTYMDSMFYGCSNELIIKIKTEYKNIKEEAFYIDN